MAPFDIPTTVLSGFKERPESLLVQGDRLYIGTAAGNIHTYDLSDKSDAAEEANQTATLVETKTGLSKKAIDQLGYIKDINSLVVLSETFPTLYPLPSFSPPTKLIQAKGALSFAVHSSAHDTPRVQSSESSGSLSGGVSDEVDKGSIPVQTVVTTLVVGCRRKVVVCSWKDGVAQEVKETPLPHSPRGIAFLDSSHACFAYSPTEYAIFSLENSTVVDVTMPTTVPTAPSSSALGMGTFSGLSSYMTLGLGSKTTKPGLARVGEGEVVVVKENQGFVIDADGKTKGTSITWPSQPEEIAFVNPYIFAIHPAGTVPATAESSNSISNALLPTSSSLPQGTAQSQMQPSYIQTPVIQIISSISMLPVQTIPFPFHQPSGSPDNTSVSLTNGSNPSLRLLTANVTSTHPSTILATTSKAPFHLFFISTPLDRTLAATEGTSIWQFTMRDWDVQIDELVACASYTEALALLDRVYGPSPSPKRTLILALNAVAQFRSGKYDEAINAFLDLDVNPAKIVALYPDKVAGRLAVKQEEWVALFGGPVAPSGEKSAGADDGMSTKSSDGGHKDGAAPLKDRLAAAVSRSPSPAGSVRARTKTSFGGLLPAAVSVSKEDDVASLSGKKKGKIIDDTTRSLETLWRYLTSLRPKLAGALATHHITPSQSHLFPTLSSTSPESLYSLPSGVALIDLTEDELVKRAQIVDTALFKSYLVGRPSMLGPLCRLPNWCEVAEVEEELRAREKHTELVFLYNGRKMHAKALKLLQQLSEKEDDMRDKLGPSISYLQKLGPEYLDQIFESAHWVFEQDREMAFEIFTSDDVELPRSAVTDYLEKFDPNVAARYLEYLIDEKEEKNANFHDRLAELYLGITMTAKRKGENDKHAEVYAKLLKFIDTTEHYRPDRLYGLLSEDLYEARAILLGHMGRHEHALEMYVYKLGDFAKAEEHCRRISSPAPTPSPIFLTLLKLYLRPTIPNPPNLLSPALSLIARHSARLDSIETLQLLPPLVNAHDVRPFLVQSLRVPILDNRVVREISLARKEDVERQLMKLESRRVKVTDSRICPQCHKRLGNSVIAVHSPRGEVTHYQCREAFSRRLNTLRQAEA